MKNNYFRMLTDKEFSYDKKCLEGNDDFLIFKVEDDKR